MKKLLLSLVAAAMVLSGCSKKQSNESLNVFHDYETTKREVTTLNYLGDYQATNLRVAAQFVDGLVENNQQGELVPALAKDYSRNDDATVWTFNLKQGIKWLRQDKSEFGEVKAQDFVTAIKYTLDAENESNNSYMITDFIKGADEYYEASKKGNATDEMFENVGVKALDDYTLEFTMVGSKPYFDTVLTYGCYYPVSAEFLEEIGTINFGVDKDKILYNGCYILEEFEQNAQKRYVKNEQYWDAENVSFDEVVVTMLEDPARAFDMFENGELDRAVLTQDQVKVQHELGNKNLVETIAGPYSWVCWFNFDKAGDDNWNKAVANVNFRKAWFYGVDTTEQRKRINMINPDALKNNAYTAAGLVKDSKGTDYTKLEELKEFTSVDQYQPTKAAEYKAKAMDELKAQGVTFPVKVTFAVKSGDETAQDTYRIIKQSYEESLGKDFIEFEAIEYIQSSTSEVYAKNLQSIMFSGWGADFGDPINYLAQLATDGTMNSNYVHYSDATLDSMLEEGEKIIDLDTRYHELAKIEAYILDNAYVSPIYSDGHEVQVTRINDYSKANVKYGIASSKMKNWESRTEAYTTEEWKELAK